MPQILSDVKLDFKDVLLRPKRSTLRTRADVQLERQYAFRNSEAEYTGVPVIASNMDTVGTFEMASVMAAHDCFTCIHKHYSVDAWLDFAQKAGSFLFNLRKKKKHGIKALRHGMWKIC